jgi:hypothetical protein
MNDERIDNIELQISKHRLAAMEAERLSRKFNKEYFDCKDLMAIIGIGRDNVRALMRSEGFPTITLENRKVVSIVAFILWQLRLTA